MRELVGVGELPPGCVRVMDAMARCHFEFGAGVRERELLIGYGSRGDQKRLQARAHARGEPPVHEGIAEEAQLSRRWTIACVALLQQAAVLRRWFGGPRDDYRENGHAVTQRARKTGERQEFTHGIGGSGWANAYTVEGIPDPLPPERPSDPAPRPPDPAPQPPEKPEGWQRVYAGHEMDRIERQRRRLAEEERRRGP